MPEQYSSCPTLTPPLDCKTLQPLPLPPLWPPCQILSHAKYNSTHSPPPQDCGKHQQVQASIPVCLFLEPCKALKLTPPLGYKMPQPLPQLPLWPPCQTMSHAKCTKANALLFMHTHSPQGSQNAAVTILRTHPPTGLLKAAATPAAAPVATISDRSWSVHSFEAQRGTWEVPDGPPCR